MSKIKYNTDGFQLLTELKAGLLTLPVAASTKIEKGHAVHDNGSGYMVDSVTAFTSLFMGIAAATVDNSTGNAGDKNVLVIPPVSGHRFAVPVAADNLVAITDRGVVCDLEAAGTIDTSDESVASGPGFMVEEIDVSADAVAVNTYGYAIGRFTYIS